MGKFLTFVSKWNLDKQNITCIYIKYIVVCVYCEQFVLFLSKYCYQYSFNLFEERKSKTFLYRRSLLVV